MSLSERQERWGTMMARVEENTVQHWCESFMEALMDDSDVALLPEAVAAGRDADVRAAAVRPSPGRRAASLTTTKN
jgi:trehalose-6-phosphate synthase